MLQGKQATSQVIYLARQDMFFHEKRERRQGMTHRPRRSQLASKKGSKPKEKHLNQPMTALDDRKNGSLNNFGERPLVPPQAFWINKWSGVAAILAPPGSSWLLLAPPGSSWLLLAPPGSSWLLLAPPGSSWLLLAPPGSSWLLLAPPGSSWLPPGSSWLLLLLLAPPGSSWLLLAPPGSSWLLLAPPGSSWLFLLAYSLNQKLAFKGGQPGSSASRSQGVLGPMRQPSRTVLEVCQEDPRTQDGARRSQEEPGGARKSQEEPGGARRTQEDAGPGRMPGTHRRTGFPGFTGVPGSPSFLKAPWPYSQLLKQYKE